MNGVVFVTNMFANAYDDATFIAFVRNGLAMCESYIRRGGTAAQFGRIYEKICNKMINDSVHIKNYHIMRLEDMRSDPVGFLKPVYRSLDLDVTSVAKIRFMAKQSMKEDNTRDYTLEAEDRKLYWLELEELGNYFRKDINQKQTGFVWEVWPTSPIEQECLFRIGRGVALQDLGCV